MKFKVKDYIEKQLDVMERFKECQLLGKLVAKLD